MRKIFVVGPSKEYSCWMEGVLVNDIKIADLVVFTGGEDVHPRFYNETPHPASFHNLSRDYYEYSYFREAYALEKKMLGICRGAQFLCVMAGGRLVQHQQNPFYMHEVIMYDGENFATTSTHHQAQYPWSIPNNEFKVLGWTKGISRFHQDGSQFEMDLPEGKECEIVFYPGIKALGIQGHPEMLFNKYSKEQSNAVKQFRKLLRLHMSDKL